MPSERRVSKALIPSGSERRGEEMVDREEDSCSVTIPSLRALVSRKARTTTIPIVIRNRA